MTLTHLHSDDTQPVDDDARPAFPTRPPLATAVDVYLGIHDVCALAGLTYRQADFWLRCGYIECDGDGQGSGTVRAFTLTQTRRVLLVAWLTKGGLTPQQAVSLVDGDAAFLLAAFPGGAT